MIFHQNYPEYSKFHEVEVKTRDYEDVSFDDEKTASGAASNLPLTDGSHGRRVAVD